METLMTLTVRRHSPSHFCILLAISLCAGSIFGHFTLFAKPIVIAHRGASGYLPEHTLASAALAVGLGADYIEPDLVLSKDGIPVVLHDIHLDATTDVRVKFPNRKRGDGRWYAIDFTLAELKQLNLHERRSIDSDQPVFSNRFPTKTPHFTIPTFTDMLDLMQGLNTSMQRNIGIYPEIKSPAFHRKEGQDISRIVLDIVRSYGLDRKDAPIFIQCFDTKELRRIRTDLKAELKIIQLIGESSKQESDFDYAHLLSKSGLAEIRTYADGIGPAIHHLFSVRDNRRPLAKEPNQIVEWAHGQNLLVHPYTLRKEQLGPAKNLEELQHILFNILKVDGLFTDFSDLTRRFIDHRK